MNVIVIGSGYMGRAVAYDLCKFSHFEKITIVDSNRESLRSAKEFLKNSGKVLFQVVNAENRSWMKELFEKNDVAISALPYQCNHKLTCIAIETQTHFLDLGGNNDVVSQQRSLTGEAAQQGVTIIPDCGLAPGLVSTITRDIVNRMDTVLYVKLRVGGLPLVPTGPLKYQISWSPNGLINEYLEPALVLEDGEIIKKDSMTGIERIEFPEPFGWMEAFYTSGGCSTLPYTYRDTIERLDYKTIRYPGHCEKFKILLDLGLGSEIPVEVGEQHVVPRDLLINQLLKNIPTTGDDVILVKVLGCGYKETNHDKITTLEYTMIDRCDKENNVSAMMRTTGFSISAIAQMIEEGAIEERGVFCPEEIVPPEPFFQMLKLRGINIQLNEKTF